MSEVWYVPSSDHGSLLSVWHKEGKMLFFRGADESSPATLGRVFTSCYLFEMLLKQWRRLLQRLTETVKCVSHHVWCPEITADASECVPAAPDGMWDLETSFLKFIRSGPPVQRFPTVFAQLRHTNKKKTFLCSAFNSITTFLICSLLFQTEMW